MKEKLKNMIGSCDGMRSATFAFAIASIPEIKPEPLADRFRIAHPSYVGWHEIDPAKIYDAEFSAMNAEKDARAEKFRKTHDMRKKSKDMTPADRKRNKKMRMQKLYGLAAFEDTNHGKTVFYWDKKGGQKKHPEYEAEIFRNMKDAEIEKSAYADMTPDAEHYVGYNTVQRIMYNADKRMREIRAEMCNRRDDDEVVETYDDSYMLYYADGNGYQCCYPDEYYNEKATWNFYEYMIHKHGIDYANKYAKGECY